MGVSDLTPEERENAFRNVWEGMAAIAWGAKRAMEIGYPIPKADREALCAYAKIAWGFESENEEETLRFITNKTIEDFEEAAKRM